MARLNVPAGPLGARTTPLRSSASAAAATSRPPRTYTNKKSYTGSVAGLGRRERKALAGPRVTSLTPGGTPKGPAPGGSNPFQGTRLPDRKRFSATTQSRSALSRLAGFFRRPK